MDIDDELEEEKGGKRGKGKDKGKRGKGRGKEEEDTDMEEERGKAGKGGKKDRNSATTVASAKKGSPAAAPKKEFPTRARVRRAELCCSGRLA